MMPALNCRSKAKTLCMKWKSSASQKTMFSSATNSLQPYPGGRPCPNAPKSRATPGSLGFSL